MYYMNGTHEKKTLACSVRLQPTKSPRTLQTSTGRNQPANTSVLQSVSRLTERPIPMASAYFAHCGHTSKTVTHAADYRALTSLFFSPAFERKLEGNKRTNERMKRNASCLSEAHRPCCLSPVRYRFESTPACTTVINTVTPLDENTRTRV